MSTLDFAKPWLINWGSYSSNSHFIWYFFMVPPQSNSRKRGLLIQGWHYKGHVEHRTSEQQMGYFYETLMVHSFSACWKFTNFAGKTNRFKGGFAGKSHRFNGGIGLVSTAQLERFSEQHCHEDKLFQSWTLSGLTSQSNRCNHQNHQLDPFFHGKKMEKELQRSQKSCSNWKLDKPFIHWILIAW